MPQQKKKSVCKADNNVEYFVRRYWARCISIICSFLRVYVTVHQLSTSRLFIGSCF